MRFPNFCGGSGRLRSILADQERTVNMYPERPRLPGASSDFNLYLVPGVEPITTTLPTIADLAAPTITNQGTPGATTYSYVIVARLADGVTHTAATNAGVTLTGNAVLSVTDFNRVTWPASTNASFYDVYSQPGGGFGFLIASGLTVLTFDDVGASGAVTALPMANTTGLVHVPVGAGRGHAFINGREFLVEGPLLYELSETGLLTPRGIVAVDSNPATISTNGDGGDQLFITSGSNGYGYDLTTNVLTAISALAGKATMGDMKDGYFLAFDGLTSTWYYSDLLDGLTWDPTNFVQRSGQGDPWIALRVNGPYIYLLGEQTSEVWYNAGTFPNPFARSSNGNMAVGCAAPFSVKIAGQSLVWLGQTVNGQGKVYRTDGLAPEIISEYNFDVAVAGYPTLADAVGDTDEVLGHTTYYLTFPSANATWCWDERETTWYERGTWIAESMRFDAMRTLFHAFAYEEHRWLDRQTGRVYRMSPELYEDVLDDDGNARPLRWVRRTPSLVSENRLVYFPAIELDVEVGVGLSGSGEGSDPMVMLSMSDDGGHTFGNELSTSIGRIGEYNTRVQFLRCGAARKRVWEFSGTAPVRWAILGAFLPDFEQANPGLRGAA